MKMKLEMSEPNQLYKGVFWIKDIAHPSSELFFPIPSDLNGNTDSDGLTAKSGSTHNHEKLWQTLNSEITEGKPFNYFPRGRVEISNRKANVYLNPHLCTEEIEKLIISVFNLTAQNGISKVRLLADGSDHYKSYIDNNFNN